MTGSQYTLVYYCQAASVELVNTIDGARGPMHLDNLQRLLSLLLLCFDENGVS